MKKSLLLASLLFSQSIFCGKPPVCTERTKEILFEKAYMKLHESVRLAKETIGKERQIEDAVQKDNLEKLKELLGDNIEEDTKRIDGVLEEALVCGSSKIVEYLLQNSADPNKSLTCSVSCSVLEEYPSPLALAQFLEKGERLEKGNSEKYSAVIKVLTGNGANETDSTKKIKSMDDSEFLKAIKEGNKED